MVAIVLDITKRKRLFFRFLKDNNAFSYFTKDLYLQALRQNLKKLNFSFHLGKLDKILRVELDEAINCSLCWAKTEEGNMFWSKLDKKWRQFVYSHNDL